MATPRDIRRLALQALYQLDARDGDEDAVRASIQDSASEGRVTFQDDEREQALELASRAHASRAEADALVESLAPTWPASRQPAIDRAILRLAHYEMTAGVSPPKVVVNEAIELAKQFSTERSPAFINGVLDKILKQLQRQGEVAGAVAESPEAESSDSPE